MASSSVAVFDVEGLLLRDRLIPAQPLGAAHDMDGVDVVFGGHPGGRLVLLKRQDADAWNQYDDRVWVAHDRGIRAVTALIVGLIAAP